MKIGPLLVARVPTHTYIVTLSLSLSPTLDEYLLIQQISIRIGPHISPLRPLRNIIQNNSYKHINLHILFINFLDFDELYFL